MLLIEWIGFVLTCVVILVVLAYIAQDMKSNTAKVIEPEFDFTLREVLDPATQQLRDLIETGVYIALFVVHDLDDAPIYKASLQLLQDEQYDVWAQVHLRPLDDELQVLITKQVSLAYNAADEDIRFAVSQAVDAAIVAWETA